LVAAMQQIADWLKKLDMSEYTERFAKNDIDSSVLRHLTDQDLKELGVSLGHRRNGDGAWWCDPDRLETLHYPPA
jgi:SAM domain (Sterile alpha motif)